MHDLDHRTKKTVVGILYIIGGFALLLHVLGFFERGLTFFLVALSLLIITLGIIKSGLWAYVNEKFFSKR